MSIKARCFFVISQVSHSPLTSLLSTFFLCISIHASPIEAALPRLLADENEYRDLVISNQWSRRIHRQSNAFELPAIVCAQRLLIPYLLSLIPRETLTTKPPIIRPASLLQRRGQRAENPLPQDFLFLYNREEEKRRRCHGRKRSIIGLRKSTV